MYDMLFKGKATFCALPFGFILLLNLSLHKADL